MTEHQIRQREAQRQHLIAQADRQRAQAAADCARKYAQKTVGCNQNCDQGRSCDCQLNQLDADGFLIEPERAPMTRLDLVLLFLAGGFCGGVAVLIAMALGMVAHA